MARKDHSEIVQHMADLLWWDAWATRREEIGKSIQGEISTQAPPTPLRAYAFAERALGRIEQALGLNEWAILYACWRADNPHIFGSTSAPVRDVSEDWRAWRDAHVERFAHCLAYQYMGAGVGWGDDHPEPECFTRFPRGESADFFQLASPSMARRGS